MNFIKDVLSEKKGGHLDPPLNFGAKKKEEKKWSKKKGESGKKRFKIFSLLLNTIFIKFLL